MQETHDGSDQGAGAVVSGQSAGIQQSSRQVGWKDVSRQIDDQWVRAFEAQDFRLSDASVLSVLQGVSAVSALGVVDVEVDGGTMRCLPILADGFRAYAAPVCFRRVVVGAPSENPIDLQKLITAFI